MVNQQTLNKQKKDMKKQMNAYYQNLRKNPNENRASNSNQSGGYPGTARICPVCGAALQQDVLYCPNCGTPYII